jgi:hypothetical protein
MIGLGVMMVTGIPMGMGKGKDVKKITQETELYLHLDVFIEEAGVLRRLHVNANQFNFSSLGNVQLTGGLVNFRLLLQTLDRHAGSVVRNRGFWGFLSNRPLSGLGYETRADYEKELRWLLSIP